MSDMRQAMYRYGATDKECWFCHYIVPVYPSSVYGSSHSNSCVNCGHSIQYHPETGETTDSWLNPNNRETMIRPAEPRAVFPDQPRSLRRSLWQYLKARFQRNTIA